VLIQVQPTNLKCTMALSKSGLLNTPAYHGDVWESMFQLKAGVTNKSEKEHYEIVQSYLRREHSKLWIALQPMERKVKPKEVDMAEALLRGVGFGPHAAPTGAFSSWTPFEQVSLMYSQLMTCIMFAEKFGGWVTVNAEAASGNKYVQDVFASHNNSLVMELLPSANYTLATVKHLHELGIKVMLDDFPEELWSEISDYAPYVFGFKFEFKLCLCALEIKDPENFPGVCCKAVLDKGACKEYSSRLKSLQREMFKTIENGVNANDKVRMVLECTYDGDKVKALLAAVIDPENIEMVFNSLYEQGGASKAGGYVLREPGPEPCP
jgi:hypothetical protein